MEKITVVESSIYEDRNENEIEIDILELLLIFKKKVQVIVLAALTGHLGSGICSKMILKPMYTSTSMVYILSERTILTPLADLQIGSQLTENYSVMITSRSILEQAIEDRGPNLSHTQLKNIIHISNLTDTRILNMSASDTDPVRVKVIVDAMTRVFSDRIGDVMEMIPPKIIENSVVPSVPTSPDIKKDVALGGLAMIVVACDIISLQAIINDTIRPEEDVPRYLEISVLAAIPENGEAENNPLVQKSERKKSRKEQKPILKKG